MLIGISVAHAEEFDELDLLGGWELVSYEGTYPLFTKPGVYGYTDFGLSDCKFLYLGEISSLDEIQENEDKITLPGFNHPVEVDQFAPAYNGLLYKDQKDLENSEYLDLNDDCFSLDNFFISGGNKLNLVSSEEFPGPALKFIIEALNDKEMLLKSYDGKFKVTYKRIAGVSDVKTVNAESNTDDAKTYYNIDGTKTNNPLHGIYIEKTSSAVKKIVVK